MKWLVVLLILLATTSFGLMLDKVGMLSMEYDFGIQSVNAWMVGIYGAKKQFNFPTEIGLKIAGGGIGDKVLGEITGSLEAKVNNFVAGVEAGTVVYPHLGFVGKVLFGWQMENTKYKYLYYKGAVMEIKTGLVIRNAGKWQIGIPIIVHIGICFW